MALTLLELRALALLAALLCDGLLRVRANDGNGSEGDDSGRSDTSETQMTAQTDGRPSSPPRCTPQASEC